MNEFSYQSTHREKTKNNAWNHRGNRSVTMSTCNLKTMAEIKQDCITVGCLPPACCPYLPACTVLGGVCSWRGCLPLVWGGCLPLVPGRCLPLVLGGCIPACNGADPSPVNRMTDRCKNITLPQTSFAGGKNVNKTSIIECLKEHKNAVLTSGKQVSNTLAKYFSTVGEDYAKKIQHQKQICQHISIKYQIANPVRT